MLHLVHDDDDPDAVGSDGNHDDGGPDAVGSDGNHDDDDPDAVGSDGNHDVGLAIWPKKNNQIFSQKIRFPI